jgi:hypothetical protein
MTAWPAPPATAALHGPAGEFVTRTAPHIESDPMALLAQFLVAIGAAAGRDVHYAVEATRHHLNEFVILGVRDPVGIPPPYPILVFQEGLKSSTGCNSRKSSRASTMLPHGRAVSAQRMSSGRAARGA